MLLWWLVVNMAIHGEPGSSPPWPVHLFEGIVQLLQLGDGSFLPGILHQRAGLAVNSEDCCMAGLPHVRLQLCLKFAAACNNAFRH